MANYKIYVCDKCKCESRTDNLKTVSVVHYNINDYNDDDIRNIELCESCRTEFENMVKQFMGDQCRCGECSFCSKQMSNDESKVYHDELMGYNNRDRKHELRNTTHRNNINNGWNTN